MDIIDLYAKQLKSASHYYVMSIYSHSRLSCFEDCPQKYKLHYIDRVETEIEESIEAFLGSRVHDTLEKLYNDLRYKKENSLEDLINLFHNEWKKNWNDNIVIVKKDLKPENYQKMGEKYITDYYNRYKPFNQGKTITLENEMIFNLDESGDYKIKGLIDRLTEKKDGVYEIHDYKTSIYLPSIEDIQSDRQLALYAIGVKQTYQNVEDIHLIWHYLAFDKELQSKRTDAQLEQLKKDTIQLINNIEEEKTFSAQPSYICEWCEYKPNCRQWSHLYKLEAKPANEYLKDPGVQLVNKYAELYEHRKNTDVELEKLKEALIAFAHKENVEVVFGSNNKAKISTSERTSFPKKDDKRREELVNLLKKAGKWDEVSDIDNTTLTHKIDEKEWPRQLVNQILKFQTTEKSERISISKMKNKDE